VTLAVLALARHRPEGPLWAPPQGAVRLGVLVSTVSASHQRSPSLRPAAIVLGIAAVIVLSGAALALVGSASAHAPANQLGTHVAGVPFRAIPAQADLTHVEAGGEPPADVVKALTVPANSKFVGDSNEAANADQFERSISFSVPNPSSAVALFYGKELTAAHWSLQFNGKAAGDLELIGQRNGSDGYQWRVAIVIESVNPRLSPALAGSSQTSTSSVVMTVYQVEDAS
jgi:hypothetical protein